MKQSNFFVRNKFNNEIFVIFNTGDDKILVSRQDQIPSFRFSHIPFTLVHNKNSGSALESTHDKN